MIRSINDIIAQCAKEEVIFILYSGGLDGTYLIAKLKELGFSNIKALHIDIIGEGHSTKIKQRLELLHVEYYIIDALNDFTDNFVQLAIQSKAMYNNVYPISASLSRPCIVKNALGFIDKNFKGINTILHTSNWSQNSLRRFNNSLIDLKYEGKFGTPFESTYTSREDKLQYLSSRNISFDLKVFSEDTNIWCREFEYGSYDNIENLSIPDDAYVWTQNTAHEETTFTLQFEKGIATQLNHENVTTSQLLIALRNLAGQYAVGRYVGLEEISSGHRVLEIRETPAAAILIDSIKMLEMTTFSYDTITLKSSLESAFIKEASEGRWFGEKRLDISDAITKLSVQLNGEITYKLKANAFLPISVKNKNPNYISSRNDFEQDHT